MQTISTKYYGPTNTRGSRIVAKTASGKSFTQDYLHSLTSDENHWLAAQGLARWLKWSGTMIQGDTDTGCVFVFACDTAREI
jgi:hypothetical protein